MKFIDSFQFMSSSIEKLTETLYNKTSQDKYEQFYNMKKEFPDHMDLLCRKGFYPYEWFDNNDKFNHIGLPPIESFHSKLSQKGISQEEYEHAQNVYNKLNCKTFKDYHMIYLKCDVLLLADIFQNFRKTCLEYYKLEPLNYITSPGLSNDAMLLTTGIELELISDAKVLDIIERQKRGGLCFVGSKRHVKVNNKYTRHFKTTGKWLNEYNHQHPEKPIKVNGDVRPDDNYIIYLDANNLYGWAMSQYLPYKNIRLNKDIKLEDILKTPDNNDVGYIVECNLQFPKHLHKKFKEFVPCPELTIPQEEWMSDYQLNIKNKLNIKSKSQKLTPHLYEHKNYVLHYRNLKYVVELGVKVGEIHNVVSFNQSPWLSKYITFNTDMRKKAKTDFEKDFFKLMNNAVFGKTMENLKARVNIHATTSDDNAVKWFSRVTFKNAKEVNGLYLIETFKEEIVYDKPLYVGTSILDLSKLHMMKFHYDVIQKEFNDKANLLYSDTDSLIYEIKCDDVFDWIKQHKNYFDLSESVRDDLRDDTNKKVLGCFKDECNSNIITEFIALNPKVYSFKYICDDVEKNKKTLKGVSKVTVKNEITHDDYCNVLNTNKSISRNVCSIRSFNHHLFTYVQTKTALTSFYDKMKLTNFNECVPYGFESE